MIDKQQIEREKFQNAARELSIKHAFLAIEAATGSGKGLAVMKCIDANNSGRKWLILVPETLQIINFQDDVRKHNMEHIYDKIEDVICYASLHKFKGQKLNLWLNECHRLSECKTDISKTIDYERIIADSATINEDIKDRLSSLGAFHYLRLSLKKAIETGIIPSPTIYTIPIIVNNTIKRNTVKYGSKIVKLTDRGYIDHLDKNLKYWQQRLAQNPEEDWIIGKFNKIGSERKAFFAKCKTIALTALLLKLKEKRLVCFTGSTEQCDEIGGTLAVHSKKGKKHNESVLKRYNELEISKIYFNKMGREGMNLNKIEAVIIGQLSTGNDEGLEFLQTSGRSYRAQSPEVYILYCKDTKDEKFLEKALQNVDAQYVKELKL